jgi:hypothetical protein
LRALLPLTHGMSAEVQANAAPRRRGKA